MDPISLGIQAVGFGLSIFGGLGQSKVAGEIADVSRDKAAHEQQINDIKQQQTVLESQRMQIQNVRNIQRQRALATASATSQGAQFGSGFQGGLADVTNQGLFNMQGVNQALQTSFQIYDQNKYITSDNAHIASLQGQSATDQGISSLGGAAIKAGPVIGQLFGGGNSKGLSLFGSPSGYGA
jgi:hypothetical protein